MTVPLHLPWPSDFVTDIEDTKLRFARWKFGEARKLTVIAGDKQVTLIVVTTSNTINARDVGRRTARRVRKDCNAKFISGEYYREITGRWVD